MRDPTVSDIGTGNPRLIHSWTADGEWLYAVIDGKLIPMATTGNQRYQLPVDMSDHATLTIE